MSTLYDNTPSLDQLRQALDSLQMLRVSPSAVMSYAIALDMIDEAVEASRDQQEPVMALDMISEACDADLEDSSHFVTNFWVDVTQAYQRIASDK